MRTTAHTAARLLPCVALTVSLAMSVLAAGCSAPTRNLTPRIDKHVLDNGLEVYLLEDRSAPLFTFQYWVKVGSADEWQGSPGTTGLSHFFEHMMFRGTEKFPQYFEAVSSRGGKLNAFTWLDVTVYWEKMAAADLEYTLDLESDRLRHMTVDFLNLEPEREVVKSERLLRTENSAEGALREAMAATLFTDHSYHWPTVGWMRDLNAITIEQAAEYHARYYVPNNAFIILVGDFDSEPTLELIRKYFGDFERRDIERTPRRGDAQQTAVRRTYVDKPTGTGLLQVAYRAPEGGHPDFVVLEVVEQLLTGGKSSRLQRALVYGDAPIAKSVGSFLFPFVDPSMVSLDVELLPDKSNREAEGRVEAEVARLRTELVSESDLERAVAGLRGGIVRSMATTHSRAQMMGFSVRSTGDPGLPWKRLQQYGEVTAEDVQRVARTWLDPTRRVIGNAIDSREIAGLTAEWLKAHPSGVEGLDELVVNATTLAAQAVAVRREASAIETERRAIELLEERAAKERERLAGDEEGLAALAAYIDTGEKGPVKRREALQQREAAAAAASSELSPQAQLVLRTHEALTEAIRQQPSEVSGRFGGRLVWAKQLLEGGGNPGRPPPDAERLAEWALRALALRHYAEADITGVADALAKLAPADGPLRAIWDFAHAAQRVDAGRM